MTCEFQTYLKLLVCGNTHWEDAAALRGCFSLNQQCTSEANLLIIVPYSALLHIVDQSLSPQNWFIYNENKPEDKP